MRLVLLVLASAAAIVGAQSRDAGQPMFDVVSVKRSAPAPDDGPVLDMPGALLPGGPTPADSATTRRFMAMNVELEVVLDRAYAKPAATGTYAYESAPVQARKSKTKKG